MAERTYLGEFEQIVLWTVLRMGGDGYGATILEQLNQRIDRRASPGALYATLDRLEEKRMIVSRLADPEVGRGGRRKRYMTVTVAGRSELARLRTEWTYMWEGMDAALGANEP